MIRHLSLILGLSLCTAAFLNAQSTRTPRQIAFDYLKTNANALNLNPEDVADVRISDEYQSAHNGLTHVWLQQQYRNIPVYNALFGLHVGAGDQVFHTGHRFIDNLAQRVNTHLPSLNAAKALEMAILHLGFQSADMPRLLQQTDPQVAIFEAGKVSKLPIGVSACFLSMPDGSLRLSWNTWIDMPNSADIWNIHVDAQTGLILNKTNQTVYCAAGHAHSYGADISNDCRSESPGTVNVPANLALASETYHVFPTPVESPAHGSRSIVTDPADPIASPYGWLDIDGMAGNDFTYTRGNNAWAYDDSESDNEPQVSESADGGAGLNFDFPFDPNAEPEANREAAITNLFYMNNRMHDFAYQFGFNEVAGNFQENNYGRGGKASDFVLAEALDSGGTDNANFSVVPDSINGRMQMYRWGRQGGRLVTVNAPGVIQGSYAAGITDNWGPDVTTTPVTGDVVFADDGSGDPTFGCVNLVNDATGKIVMVDRGACLFVEKAYYAQQAGGIACIICDHEQPPIQGNLGGQGPLVSQINIPVVWMKKAACDLLRQYAGFGLNISLVIPPSSGPEELDGDFDNGIIAHEYAHGISTRLTGGPSQAGCLGNAEQMGEGWSDFFTLVTTTKPGDVAGQNRGVGTFVFRQSNDGQGIRRYPYSNNMNISPLTYGDVPGNTGVHAVGEIWCGMLWDMYWAFVEKYGFDPAWTNPGSGNVRAVQLVMDGMKLQPCSPGFIDGRNAILLAETINNNGADTCLIQSVFARRGLGYLAQQNDSDNATDGIENFDPIPTCIRELKITKSTPTPLVAAGQTATFNITVTNHKGAPVSNVQVNDVLPAGLGFVSADNGGTFSAGQVNWTIPSMDNGAVVTLSYTVLTDPEKQSNCLFNDPMEEEFGLWSTLTLDGTNLEFFALQNAVAKVGQYAWRAPESANLETDFVLEQGEAFTVSGDNPVLRFWHQYNTEAFADAGFIEIKKEGDSWRRLNKDAVFRHPYDGDVQYGTFALPNLQGFFGNSQGWQQSYIDLSDYAGQSIYIRFRFGTDDNTAPTDGGWFVDGVQIIDALAYNSEACVISAQGDQACASAPARGVIVNTECLPVDAQEPDNNLLSVAFQPNPVDQLLFVSTNQALPGAVEMLLIASDGRIVARRSLNNLFAGQITTLDVQDLPDGMYVLRIESEGGVFTGKVIVR